MAIRTLSLLTLLASFACAPAAADTQQIVKVPRGDDVVSTYRSQARNVLHEFQAPSLHARWKRKGRIASITVLSVHIALTLVNQDTGARHLKRISDPESDDYGKHLKANEVAAIFAPPEAAVAAVRTWLISAGLESQRITLSPNKQWLRFEASAEVVEELLGTEYHEYSHRDRGSKGVAAREYRLPAHLRGFIDFVTPGVHPEAYPVRGKRLRRGSRQSSKPESRSNMATSPPPPLNLTSCDTYLTRDCLRAQYHIPNNSLAASGNELGIFTSVDEHYSRSDLDTFFSSFYPQIPPGTYPEDRPIDGAVGAVEDVPGHNESMTGIEANLDIMSSWPLIWPQREVLFQTDDQWYETVGQADYPGFWNTFLDVLDGSYCTYSAYNESGDCTDAACRDPVYPDPHPGGYSGSRQCGLYKPTNVISISFGGGELDMPSAYLRRQCDEILKLALQGVTVVVSAGDNGPAGAPRSDRPNGCSGPNGAIFSPTRPSVCPYALSVGATQLLRSRGPNGTTYTEVAANFSGGGFSNYFDRPWWQDRAVPSYFERAGLGFPGYEALGVNFSQASRGVYRAGGRGYPDVSAAGQHYGIFRRGAWGRGSGTSLAAPIWAAVLTLINERRIMANKSTVGLVHPVLYAHPDVFNDITEGSAPACNLSGFPAVPGWDPISGLGTPNFAKLVDIFLSLK